jgi:hypothetical protein
MAVPAVAVAFNSPELQEAGVRVNTGSLIQATNSESVVMTNESGEQLLACSTATMTWSVVKNDGSSIEANITAADVSNGATTDCGGLLGPFRYTSNPATNGLPWCIKSTSTVATDEFQIRGNSCAGLSGPIRFELDVTLTGQICIYQRSSPIPGTTTTGVRSTVLSISKAEFPLVTEGSSCGCPARSSSI